MAKHLVLNKGFSLLESMLTLFVVSLISFVALSEVHVSPNNMIDREIENISYFFHHAQTSSISSKERKVIFVYQPENEIMRISSEGSIEETIALEFCLIKQNSLSRFSYLPSGDTNAFGTIRFNCDGKDVNFIFQIQKGRFRIEQ